MKKYLVALLGICLFFLPELIYSKKIPDIVRQGDTYYLIRPFGKKVELVKANRIGSPNKFIFFPELNLILFSKNNGLAFESYGSDLFLCSWDGSNITFLQKSYGDLDTAINFHYKGKDFIIIGYSVSEDTPFIEVLDLQSKQFFAHMPGEVIEIFEDKHCYKTKYPDRIICVDTLFELSKNAKTPVNLVIRYAGDEIYLTHRELPLLKLDELPEIILSYFDTSEYIGKSEKRKVAEDFQKKYIGCCFSTAEYSPDRRFFAFATYAAGEFNWLGIFNLTEEKVIYLDCIYHGEHNDICWSPDGRLLAFIRKTLNGDKEIVILRENGDTNFSYFQVIAFTRDVNVSNLKWDENRKLSYSIADGQRPTERKYLDLTEK